MSEQVTLYQCERYPFYGIAGGTHDVAAEVPVETLERWQRVMAEFETVQEEMKVAHSTASARDAEAARIKAAEDDVAKAQARLDRARREQTHRPDNPASWPSNTDGTYPCVGIQYANEKEAWTDRVRLHHQWPGMTFDVAPFVCVEGHHHLGRTS